MACCGTSCLSSTGCANLPLVSSDAHTFYPLIDDGGEGCEEAFPWAAPCAKACAFIYHPEDCVTLLFNDLDYNVNVKVIETSEKLTLVSGLAYTTLKCRRPVDGAELRELTLHFLVPSSKVPGRSVLLLSAKIATNCSYHLVALPSVVRPGSRAPVRLIKVPYTSRTNFTLHHVQRSQGVNPVQWGVGSSSEKRRPVLPGAKKPEGRSEGSEASEARRNAASRDPRGGDADAMRRDAVQSARTVIVMFKGSDSLMDMVIDAGGLPMYVGDLGLQVHGTMWAALHVSAKTTADQVLEQLEPFAQRPSSSSPAGTEDGGDDEPIDLILTGHSLGGGFALLVALELLARGRRRYNQGQGVTGAEEEATSGDWRFSPLVLTFGAPMVIVPDLANDLWRDLNDRAYLFVNAWDVIPRMPSAERWLFEVMPASTGVLGVVWGAEREAEKHVRPAFGCLELFDTCGTIVFMDNTQPGAVMCLRSDGSGRTAGAHRVILDAPPPVLGPHVVRMHDVRKYERATARLSYELAWRARSKDEASGQDEGEARVEATDYEVSSEISSSDVGSPVAREGVRVGKKAFA